MILILTIFVKERTAIGAQVAVGGSRPEARLLDWHA